MEVRVSLISRGGPEDGVRDLRISVDPSDDVAILKRRLGEKGQVDPDSLRLLFCGRELSEGRSVLELGLGPSSVLHAVVLAQPRLPVPAVVSEPEHPDLGGATNSFFVFCKEPCNALRPAKLRVRCSGCRSSAVVLLQEPNCWNDVLSRKRLEVECHGKEGIACDQPFADFFFKCAECSDKSREATGATILPQGGLRDGNDCCTCGEVPSLALSFACPSPNPTLAAHIVCLDCFSAYASVSLQERRFVMDPADGYTLKCPVSGCAGGVRDGHHFRLAGPSFYSEYQSRATEACLLSEGGLYCPRAECGEAFLVPSDSSASVLCPTCSHRFCGVCRESDCACEGGEPEGGPEERRGEAVENRRTIQRLCRGCPRCGVWTERNGGCHHMSCVQCGFAWCWLCARPWSDDCQMNHWFDTDTL